MSKEMYDIGQQLLDLGAEIDGVLNELFPPLAGGENDFLTPALQHHMSTGGKRIRPALCLLTCEELGGDKGKALNFAAAVEILHNMFLVHDDLQDGDRVRRNSPAVWVKFGAGNAINLGDYMLGRAYTSILKSDVNSDVKLKLLQLFTRTFETTCRGQALDLNWRGMEDFGVEKYMKIVQRKTADYLVLGMLGGGVIAGAPDDALAAIRKLGAFMGPAFQIRDDVIDLTEGKGRGGELGNDIKEGKPSILFAHALNNASKTDKEELLDVIRRSREGTDTMAIKNVVDIYEKYGSFDFARTKAEELTKKAYDEVNAIPLKNKDIFRCIVKFLNERIT